ncbi:hypothetical protein KW797_04915 [Candidatus Parcubacteria bacterium]|nr:hypothetical protein [Candidatus Parcubacteria bacterium]
MLYLFHGGRDARIKAIGERKDALMKKDRDALYRPLAEEEWNGPSLEELARGQGLFGGTAYFLIKEFLATKEDREFFMDMAPLLGRSHNVFFVSEPSATKEMAKAVEKAGGEVVALAEGEKAKRDGSNFALADAAAKRDRKLSWALFLEALGKGASAEELHGILFWQMKNLVLAKHAASGTPLSFPLMKARSASALWKDGELDSALSRLVSIYHESHRGLYELPVALELFLLETV